MADNDGANNGNPGRRRIRQLLHSGIAGTALSTTRLVDWLLLTLLNSLLDFHWDCTLPSSVGPDGSPLRRSGPASRKCECKERKEKERMWRTRTVKRNIEQRTGNGDFVARTISVPIARGIFFVPATRGWWSLKVLSQKPDTLSPSWMEVWFHCSEIGTLDSPSGVSYSSTVRSHVKIFKVSQSLLVTSFAAFLGTSLYAGTVQRFKLYIHNVQIIMPTRRTARTG